MGGKRFIPKSLRLHEFRSLHELSTGTLYAREPKIPMGKYNELTLGGKDYKARSLKLVDTAVART